MSSDMTDQRVERPAASACPADDSLICKSTNIRVELARSYAANMTFFKAKFYFCASFLANDHALPKIKPFSLMLPHRSAY